MFRVDCNTGHISGAWLGPMMARSAKGHEVVQRVRLGDGPRNDVVNVKATARAGQTGSKLSARLAGVPVSRSGEGGLRRPIGPASVVPGRSALPSRAFFAAFRADARSDVARMAAKSARLTIEAIKRLSALLAVLWRRPDSTPTGLVIARHSAEQPRLCVIGERFKRSAASFAGLDDPRSRLGRLARPGTIPPATVASDRAAAFLAMLTHSKNICGLSMKIKYFEIACKRVDEAARQPDLLIPAPQPQPVQEELL